MTYKLVGDTLGVDHSTVIYGSIKAKNQVEIGDRQYAMAMVNWRMIFDENEIDIKVEIDQKARVKARIQNLLIDAITDGVLSIEERDELLVSMLRTKMIHSNRVAEEQLY